MYRQLNYISFWALFCILSSGCFGSENDESSEADTTSLDSRTLGDTAGTPVADTSSTADGFNDKSDTTDVRAADTQDSSDSNLSNFKIVPQEISVPVGQEIILTIESRDVIDSEPTWSSVQPTFATVNPIGSGEAATISGLKAGTTSIEVQSGGKTTSASVIVEAGRKQVVPVGGDDMSTPRFGHTCALGQGGALVCWGANLNQQFGNDSDRPRMQRLQKSPVPTLWDKRTLTFDSADAQTCAITQTGDSYCWGRNIWGSLGIGEFDSPKKIYSTPQLVDTNESFADISTGLAHACALADDGTAYCWGDGDKLGLDSQIDKKAPVPISEAHKFVKIEAADDRTCAIKQNGSLYCWPGKESQTPKKIDFDQPGKVLDVAVGNGVPSNMHICTALENGDVYCWGNNEFGQVAPSDASENIDSPRKVSVAGDFYNVAVGQFHTCAVEWNGRVKCWGANLSGQLGNGEFHPRSRPSEIMGDHRFTSVRAGGAHTCGVTRRGAIYCWGNNQSAQLGNGKLTGWQVKPIESRASKNWKSLGLGGHTTCGLTQDDSVFCWGEGDVGQLGSGKRTNRFTPKQVSGSHRFESLAVGRYFSCAGASSGGVYCWGNQHSELPNMSSGSLQPTAIPGSERWIEPSMTRSTVCYHNSEAGTPICFGDGSRAFFDFSPISGSVSKVQAGYGFVLILTGSGKLYAVGGNQRGQLGIGPGGSQAESTAKEVQTSARFQTVSAGLEHACGITNNDELLCWGNNLAGQLGTGDKADRDVPTTVVGSIQFSKVSAGEYHTCGLDDSGTAYCWGSPSWGELGTGQRTKNQLTPEPVQTNQTFKSIIAGDSHSCGLTDQEKVFCWGQNFAGELNQPIGKPEPVKISTATQ